MGKKTDYTLMFDGDIATCKHGDSFFMSCCDCDLVHLIKVKIDPDSMIAVLTVHRDNKRTSQLRRRRKERKK